MWDRASAENSGQIFHEFQKQQPNQKAGNWIIIDYTNLIQILLKFFSEKSVPLSFSKWFFLKEVFLKKNFENLRKALKSEGRELDTVVAVDETIKRLSSSKSSVLIGFTLRCDSLPKQDWKRMEWGARIGITKMPPLQAPM